MPTANSAPQVRSPARGGRLLRSYLSAVLLVGLLLNAPLGWSRANPIAALVIAAVAVKEGLDAWQGKSCGAPTAHTPTPPGPPRP